MQQIADWLEKLGLSECADRFAENDVDTSVLRHLTDQDLKELGVSLGHRRKMLAAIAELPGTIPSKPEPVGSVEPKPQETAERRQVTVMFSDLVGSTALSARMDPEDLREVISAYQKCVAETVGRFGGYVAKLMGDGVLIFFGYPQAHEDDAERAVRAGLESVTTVSGLKTHGGESLARRVGGIAARNQTTTVICCGGILKRLCIAESLGAKVTEGICYAAVYECEALIGYGGRFGTAKAVGVNPSRGASKSN